MTLFVAHLNGPRLINPDKLRRLWSLHVRNVSKSRKSVYIHDPHPVLNIYVHSRAARRYIDEEAEEDDGL